MTQQIDYQVILEEVVRTANKAAQAAKENGNAEMLFAYYDILDVIKTQADIMEIPPKEIGMQGINLDDLIKATSDISKHKQAA